jgi:nicotinate-nucleotide adenylyltransferase
MKRIGLFGGSFNPIHLGHTALAAYICEQGLADEVWLMVSPQNPLKQDLTLLDENERLHMARLAVAPYPMLKACDFEFTLPRPSYTYHTLQALREAYPDCTFSLIIGEDNWDNFHRWYRGEDIARETPIIVYPRDAEGELRIEGKDSKARTPNSQQTIDNSQQSPKLLPYSSTEVRHLIAQGEDASHMLHPEVYQYIKAKQLYTK